VEKTSRHMDWNGVPDSAQGRLTVSVWHDVVEDAIDKATGKLPTNDEGLKPGDMITIWQGKDLTKSEIVNFSQQNLVSGIGALITALPARQRLSSADLVVPASSFPIPYVLCQTMAALYQHTSLAITSVAEPGVDLALATRGVAPTVIIASAESMAALHTKESAGMSGLAQKYGKFSQSQTLSAGRMPTDGLLFRVLAPHASASGNKPGTLRLILTSERTGCGTPPLTSTMLSDLRIFTRARICYALTAAKVCGAVAQSNVFDYRQEDGTGPSHFGLPLSSVEIKLVNKDDQRVAGTQPEGEIVVSGPAVAGTGDLNIGVKGRLREDGTLQLV
jgi:acyl-CoA synthetase (AMP-forming)/AMP-acid ligase II